MWTTYLLRAITECSNEPVGVAVVRSVRKTIQDIYSTGSCIARIVYIHTLCLSQAKLCFPHHEVSCNPDSVDGDENIDDREKRPLPAAKRQLVRKDVEDPSGRNLNSARDEGVEGSTADREVDAVEVVALVNVVIVDRPAHWPEENDPPVPLADLPRRLELFFKGFLVCLQHDARAVFSYNLLPRIHSHTHECTEQHQSEEANVGSVIDTAVVRCAGVPILRHGDGSSDNDTELEDGPKYRHVESLLVFARERGNGCPFGTPEQGGREAAPTASENDKRHVSGMVEAPQAGEIGRIPDASGAQRES